MYYVAIGSRGEYLGGDTRMVVRSASNDPNPLLVDTRRDAIPVRQAIYRAPNGDIVAVAQTLGARRAALERVLIGTVVASLLQLLAMLIIVWFVLRVGLEEVRRIGQQIVTISGLEQKKVPESSAPTELRPLVLALNSHIDRVHDAIRARQQFVADAAHQLRKPLSSLCMSLDQLGNSTVDPPDTDRIDEIRIQAARLTLTTNRLLSLAQSDAETTPDQFESVDLRQLIAAVAARFLDRALDRHIDLGLDGSAITIQGVPWLLTEMLTNLLDNAFAYTPNDGRITLRCGQAGDHAFLEVEDDGTGIPSDEHQRVFERFYRGRAAQGDGAGLGLAIVKRVARTHRATFSLDSTIGAGTRVRLEFPSCTERKSA
jgi:two-component system sensor histidine kinase TctE